MLSLTNQRKAACSRRLDNGEATRKDSLAILRVAPQLSERLEQAKEKWLILNQSGAKPKPITGNHHWHT